MSLVCFRYRAQRQRHKAQAIRDAHRQLEDWIWKFVYFLLYLYCVCQMSPRFLCFSSLSYMHRPKEWQVNGNIAVTADGVRRSAANMLRYPGVTVDRLQKIAGQMFTPKDGETSPLLQVDPEAIESVQVHCKYADYLKAQAEDIKQFRLAVSAHLKLPPGYIII